MRAAVFPRRQSKADWPNVLAPIASFDWCQIAGDAWDARNRDEWGTAFYLPELPLL
jgi:hypothetical protein